MTWTITIDPVELMDTAVLLGTSAVELADVGSTLRTCTACAMPPEVRNSVDNLVAVADRIFDDMALQLRAEAADLAQRAIIAANDMLTAAGYPPLPGTTITTTPGAAVTSNLPMTADGIPINPPAPAGSGFTIGGGNWGTITASPSINFGANIIGGGSGSWGTITGPSFDFGANIIGGGSGSWGTLTGLPEGFNFGANIVGGGRPYTALEQAILRGSGQMTPASAFPMPGARSLSDLPTMSIPFLKPAEHHVIAKVEREIGRPVGFLTPADNKHYGRDD